MKPALLSFYEQFVVQKSLEDLSDMLDMFLCTPRKDEDVIQIDKDIIH